MSVLALLCLVRDRAHLVRCPSSSPSRWPPGYGIVGMRERAELLGGHVDAGPRPEGGFRVTARLPLAEAAG